MSQISPIINLGYTGLTGLVLQAYIQATGDSVATPVDPSGISISPRLDFAGAPTSNYQLVNLPSPPPGGFGMIVILSSSGDLLREYSYIAPSPTALILYRSESSIVSNGPFTSADTVGLIQLAVTGLPDPTNATITFSCKTATDSYILQDRPAEVSAIQLLSDGSYSFLLSHALEPGHAIAVAPPVGSVMILYAEFLIDYGGGIIKGVPGDSSLTIRVRKTLSQ